jgi:hypothetical protein
MRTTSLALTAVVGAIISSAMGVRAQDEATPQGVLAIAKMAGACGILDSPTAFQRTMQLRGGNEFVMRVWAVEATRLGMSMQEYSDQ